MKQFITLAFAALLLLNLAHSALAQAAQKKQDALKKHTARKANIPTAAKTGEQNARVKVYAEASRLNLRGDARAAYMKKALETPPETTSLQSSSLDKYKDARKKASADANRLNLRGAAKRAYIKKALSNL